MQAYNILWIVNAIASLTGNERLPNIFMMNKAAMDSVAEFAQESYPLRLRIFWKSCASTSENIARMESLSFRIKMINRGLVVCFWLLPLLAELVLTL